MGAPSEGQTVQFYPERGGQLATLNAISAITPLQAQVVALLPLFRVVLYVNDPSLARPYIKKNVPYFDSEYATRPYQTLIPGVGGYCVDPTDAPPFPPPVVVPTQPASWNMPLSPAEYPANPADSEQPFVPVKIMEDDTSTTPAVEDEPAAATQTLDLTPLATESQLTFQFPVADNTTTTVAFTNPPETGTFTVQVLNGGPGSAVVWPSSVTNASDLTLSGITGKLDTFTFTTSDSGTAYTGVEATAEQ